jgi:hypothetical protein
MMNSLTIHYLGLLTNGLLIRAEDVPRPRMWLTMGQLVNFD